jgi:parallel beta-helix repeat protein
MRNFRFLPFILLFYASAFCQTNVGGLITENTTWDLAGSPYVITGNLLVFPDITLTIEPGVTVKFNPRMAFQINGTLVARGTAAQKITFTFNDEVPVSGYMPYLFFNYTSQSAVFNGSGQYVRGSIFEHVVFIIDGALYSTGAVTLNNATPYFNKCSFIRNRGWAVSGSTMVELRMDSCVIDSNFKGGVWFTGPLRIRDSRICGNHGHGISHNTRNLVMTGNLVAGNMGNGIRHYSRYESNSLALVIRHNTLRDNVQSGLDLYCDSDNSTLAVDSNFVAENDSQGVRIFFGWYREGTINGNRVVFNGSDGIYLRGSDPTMTLSGNLVYKNGGQGISLSMSTTPQNITNNLVIENGGPGIYDSLGGSNSDTLVGLKGAVAVNTVYRNGGPPLRVSGHAEVTRNTFLDNNLTGDTVYTCFLKNGAQVVNYNNFLNSRVRYHLVTGNPSTAPFTDAKNNFWGTVDDAEVQDLILDFMDTGTRGVVLYDPFLTEICPTAPITPPQNVRGTIEGTTIGLAWDPNPEADAAGYRIYYGGYTGYSFENSVDAGNVTSYVFTPSIPVCTLAVTAYDNSADGADDMYDGNESWFSEIVVGNTGIRDKRLMKESSFCIQAAPNPFNSLTRLSYNAAGPAKLCIYDIKGALINRFTIKGRAGQIVWDGRDMRNGSVPVGIYFARMTGGGQSQTIRVLKLR